MNTSDTELVLRDLRKQLPRLKGRITAADASAATGHSYDAVRDALDELMNIFVCRLQVTESGEILYDFGGSLRRRGSKTLRERLGDAGRFLWKAFTIGFKLWITVMLVVYFTAFVVILIAMLLGGKDTKRGIKLGWIADLFADMFRIRGARMAVGYAVDSDGLRHRELRQIRRRQPDVTEENKRLVQSVYDFVFGPPRPDFDPFANEKEVAAWLRREKGILTMTELVALAGWTYDEASERMAEYLTRFKGDADITEDGVLIGRFDRLLLSGDRAAGGGKVELFWDEYEAPYVMTGNSTGRNAFIAFMNGFNLLFSLAMFSSPGGMAIVMENAGIPLAPDFIHVVFGIVPLLFSVIFFAVPLLRFPSVWRAERRRHLRNLRRRILRIVFEEQGRPFTAAQLHARIAAAGGKVPNLKELEAALAALLPYFDGRTTLEDDGTVLYVFDRVGHEVQVARRERTVRQTPGLGKVLFDTGESTTL
ncbi:MAG: hypothetical protein M5R41_03075 [Bacteroidia bacterium]|nr:hypothetical protein [Bacteroidia bacterium]